MENVLNEQVMLNDIFYSRFVVNEETRGKRPGVLSTIEGPFMEIDTKNRNSRAYSKSLVENRIINTPYTKEMLANKILLGEGRHPADRFEIWATEASHNITDLWIDDDKKILMGKADILDTPTGRIIQTLVDYGSSLGVSARASGKVVKQKDVLVVDEESYNFKTFDFVTNPGFESARVVGVNESVEDTNYLEGIYVSVKSLIDDRNTDISTLNAVKSIIESVNYDKMKELLPIIEEIESNSTGDCDLIKLKEEATELSEENQLVTSQLEKVLEELDEKEIRINELEKENATLKSLLSSKSRVNEEFLAKEKSLNSKLKMKNKIVIELREETELVIARYKKQIEELTEQLDESYEAINDYNHMVTKLNEKLNERPEVVEKIVERIVEKVVEVPVITESVATEVVEKPKEQVKRKILESMVDSPMKVNVSSKETQGNSRLERLISSVTNK